MRGLVIFFALLVSTVASANIQHRIALFTQQTEYFRQICFLPDGTFMTDRILFDARSSIEETAIDCNAQALALRQEFDAINALTESGECPADLEVEDQGLIDLLNGNTPIVEELACPGIGDAEQCTSGIACNLIRSMMPLGAAAVSYLSNNPMLSSCASGTNCFSTIGKAILDNLWDAVKGMYHLGSMAVGWLGEQIGSLWGAEDATSQRGIAATEATDSELDRFMDDPFGFIAEKGRQFFNMIVEGISSRYGCAEWTGVPHFSECLRPMSFECADCNQKLNMVCGVVGYVGGNFVTNFFTGGAIGAVQLTGQIAKAGVFTVARNVPGGARLMEAMAAGGRLSRAAGLVTGTVRTAWAALKNSRTVQGVLSVATRVNNGARKYIFLYAPGQDLIVDAARAYHRLTFGAYRAGYRTTFAAAERTKQYLYSQFPKLSEINSGRYANVANPEQYLREATKNMPPEDRRHMTVTVSTDARGERRVIVSDRRAGTLDSDVAFDFTPAAAPTAVARAIPPQVVARAEETVEEIVVTATRRPATVASKEDFASAWSASVATTPRQNLSYIDQAVKGERPGVFFLDTQNTALKKLNDVLRDKTLVDAFGNRYNALVLEAVENFRSAHPGVVVDFYSDYKSLRAAIRGPPGQEEALMRELAALVDQKGEAFLAELRAGNYVDVTLTGENWFRAGLGRTADEANLVTRFSRRTEDVPTTYFNNVGAQTRIRSAWQMTELSRKEIAQRLAGSDLLRKVEGTELTIPKAEVLEVVRKNSDAAEIARILSGRYAVTVGPKDAELLQTYFRQVDQFSPGLLIASRVEHRFEDAVHGGFSIDFAGVGSINAEATAAGLAQGQTLRQSVVAIRERELLVTRDLDALKARTETAMRETLERHGISAEITVSGDDMVVVPNRPLTAQIRRELAEAQVAAQAGTSTRAADMRTSFFREGIPDEASRSIQATIGESIEKKLRRRLEGQLSPEELRSTLFAVDMRGSSPGSGAVGLEIVNPNLSRASRQLIERELGGAIEDVNAELRTTGQGGNLSRESTFIFSPSLLFSQGERLRGSQWTSTIN